MFGSIVDDMKAEFRHGNMVSRIIIINIILFVAVNILKVILHIPGAGVRESFYTILNYLCVPSSFGGLFKQPWSLVTSIFLHEDFGHIFWNMISFYWFGRIVGDLLGNHRVLPLYLLGGFVGTLLFIIMAQYSAYGISISSYCLGASAAVMAMIMCAAVIAPNYNFNVMLIGNVPLKYVAAVLIFIDITAIADNNNTGGRIAHLGGVVFGYLYATNLQKGRDLGAGLSRLLDWLMALFSKRKNKTKFSYTRGGKQNTQQRTATTHTTRTTQGNAAGGDISEDEARLNAILDKLKTSKYENLTDEEKAFLFKYSNAKK